MQAPFSRTYYELLVEQAQRYPDLAAVLLAAAGNGSQVEASVDYTALATRAAIVANRLREHGIRRGDRIGLLINNRIEWLELFFATSALGAILVPLSTWSKPAELDFLLRDSRIQMLFTLQSYAGQPFAESLSQLLREHRDYSLHQLVVVDGEPDDGQLGYAEFTHGDPLEALPPGSGVSAADTAILLYTSGSSNRPKCVPLQQHAAIENGFNIGERQGLRPGDRVLVSIPLFWSYGAVNALPAIVTHGASLVLQGHFEPAGALDLIERHRCTALYTLPAMTNALLAHASFALERVRSLRTGVTIGSAQDVIKAAVELGAAEICNVYGSTETYGNCCVTWHHWPLEQRAACQGPPLPGVQLRIREPSTGALCEAGVVGEVEVKGYLTTGYEGDSARSNRSAFTEDGYFRTGDLAALDADGYLCFAGRRHEMIKRSGINVSPAEVEDVLQQHPDVGLAGVTGVDDTIRGELIIAYVIPRPAATLAIEPLLAHCRARLSGYKIPDEIVICATLPLTPTGKLMRRELRALAEASRQSAID